ncbi:MAG TPA: hypothetical protein VNI52_14355 [Sphingobacteriaceae bacterium]|nr:hypothetical protein [Sphingobacteriaceae bacterium]
MDKLSDFEASCTHWDIFCRLHSLRRSSFIRDTLKYLNSDDRKS